MATKMSTDDLLDQFKEMTLLELSEFIKQFEETFDVGGRGGRAGHDGRAGRRRRRRRRRRRGAVGVRRDPHGGGREEDQVIKAVRSLTTLGLKEAKDLVDGAPKPVLEKVAKDVADQAKEQLEAEGATVEVK